MRLFPIFTAFCVLACDKSPDPASGPATVAEKPPAKADTPAAPAPEPNFTLKRTLDSFEMEGVAPTRDLPPFFSVEVAGMSRSKLAVDTMPSSTSDQRFAWEKLLVLVADTVSADVVLDKASLTIACKVWNHADETTVQLAAEDVAKGFGRALVLDCKADPDAHREDQGFVRSSDGTEPTSLKLTPIGGGTGVTPDASGRVTAGVYAINGTSLSLAVNPGKVTEVRADALATSRGVLIGGKRFALDRDVKIIAPGDEGALDFAAAKGPDDIPLYGARFVRPGQKVVNDDLLARHRADIHQVVLHQHGTPDANAAFSAQVQKGLSIHFMIDWDGTIYQGIDVGWSTWHAGAANSHSIGIDLTGLADNLVEKPKAEPWPKKHPRLAEMQSGAYNRPKSKLMSINYHRVQTWGFTDAQYESLGSLLRLLATVLPETGKGAPLGVDGKVAKHLLENPADHRGVMGHFHWEPDRMDPGPGLDWARLGLEPAR